MAGQHICPLCPRPTRIEGGACDLCRAKSLRVRRQPLPPLPPRAKCFYCKKPADCWDHVIPLNRNGDSRLANLMPACKRCNGDKRDRIPTEWCPENKKAVALEAT